MITKPTLICDGCKQAVDEQNPATIEFIPIRGGLFLTLPAAKVEHRIVEPIHLHSQECFGTYCDKLAATQAKADAAVEAKTRPAAA